VTSPVTLAEPLPTLAVPVVLHPPVPPLIRYDWALNAPFAKALQAPSMGAWMVDVLQLPFA
jgi:hypothetical protein